MRLRPLVGGVAFAVAGLAVPSYADHGFDAAGRTCGFASTNDGTGIVNQDPNVQTGEITGGPSTAFDGDSGVPAEVQIHCWIQVNNAAYGSPTNASCAATGSGVAAAVCAITYTAGPTDNVYICTEIVMQSANRTAVYQYDDDDNAANGNQCAMAISAGATPSLFAPGGNNAKPQCTYLWTDKGGGVYVTICL